MTGRIPLTDDDMPRFYDRLARPITRDGFKWLFGLGEEYRRVASTHHGDLWVSTVWLGLDHSFGKGPPMIFETMIFGQGDGAIDWLDESTQRWTSEEAALDGHRRIVGALRILRPLLALPPGPA